MEPIYRLFFRDIDLGEVIFEDQDFPSISGRFKSATLQDSPLADHIRDYIRHSVWNQQRLIHRQRPSTIILPVRVASGAPSARHGNAFLWLPVMLSATPSQR